MESLVDEFLSNQKRPSVNLVNQIIKEVDPVTRFQIFFTFFRMNKSWYMDYMRELNHKKKEHPISDNNKPMDLIFKGFIRIIFDTKDEVKPMIKKWLEVSDLEDCFQTMLLTVQNNNYQE